MSYFKSMGAEQTALQIFLQKLNRAADGELVELTPREASRFAFEDEAAEADGE